MCSEAISIFRPPCDCPTKMLCIFVGALFGGSKGGLSKSREQSLSHFVTAPFTQGSLWRREGMTTLPSAFFNRRPLPCINRGTSLPEGLFFPISASPRVPLKPPLCKGRGQARDEPAGGVVFLYLSLPCARGGVGLDTSPTEGLFCSRFSDLYNPPASLCSLPSRAVETALGQETARTMRRFQVRRRSKPHRGFAKKAPAHPLQGTAKCGKMRCAARSTPSASRSFGTSLSEGGKEFTVSPWLPL